MQRSTLAVILAVGASAVAFVTGTSIATSYRAGPAPATIATINVQKIFDEYKERDDKLKELQVKAASLEAEYSTKNTQAGEKRKKAEAMPDGPAKDAAIDEAVDEDVKLQVEIKKAKNRLEKQQADTMRMIFGKIQSKAAAVGSKAGYSMVMIADDWVTISPRATSQEATQVMSLKRFVYVDNSAHDITGTVLQQLNDDYTATKPATPAPAGATPAGGAGTAKPAPAH
ncbi:MAG: OmpH family outer membrane protein [Phycisphaerales bacterium]